MAKVELRGSVNRRVANVTTVGQEAIQSFGEMSGKKSCQPIDGASKLANGCIIFLCEGNVYAPKYKVSAEELPRAPSNSVKAKFAWLDPRIQPTLLGSKYCN
jgi:hypothetical protein